MYDSPRLVHSFYREQLLCRADQILRIECTYRCKRDDQAHWSSRVQNDDNTMEVKNGTENTDFLEQLFDNSKMPAYHLPMPVKVDIRPYQHVSRLATGRDLRWCVCLTLCRMASTGWCFWNDTIFRVFWLMIWVWERWGTRICTRCTLDHRFLSPNH